LSTKFFVDGERSTPIGNAICATPQNSLESVAMFRRSSVRSASVSIVSRSRVLDTAAAMRVLLLLALTGILGVSSVFSAETPLAVFDQFVRLFDDNYAFFELRGVDWRSQALMYRQRVSPATSNDELFGILCEMILPLDDHHVSVSQGGKRCYAAGDVPWKNKSKDIEEFVERKYLRDGGTHRGAITFGAIDNATAYIDIHHMVGCVTWFGMPRRTAKEIDEALATMTNVKKIIIDVRFNSGGYDACALGFASRFVDKKRLVYSKETYYKGAYGSHQDLFISAQGNVNHKARVLVLTSRATVSAAETFVMAMMALPQVTTLGEFTGGIHSDIYLKKLSNGWQVGLSNQRYILPDGKVYEAIGLPPKIPMTFTGDVVEHGGDEILERAIAY
jgi:hypothetical protein